MEKYVMNNINLLQNWQPAKVISANDYLKSFIHPDLAYVIIEFLGKKIEYFEGSIEECQEACNEINKFIKSSLSNYLAENYLLIKQEHPPYLTEEELKAGEALLKAFEAEEFKHEKCNHYSEIECICECHTNPLLIHSQYCCYTCPSCKVKFVIGVGSNKNLI